MSDVRCQLAYLKLELRERIQHHLNMKALLLLALVPFVYASIVSREGVTHFHGYSVVRALVSTPSEKALVESLDLDVWTGDGSLIYGLNDLMVNSSDLASLQDAGIISSLVIKDVQQLIQAEKDYKPASPVAPHDFYRTYDQIIQFLDALPTTLVQKLTVGTSIQGRAIPGIRITAGTLPGKRKIFFNGGQHAREWVSPATVLYIIDQLITDYNAKDVLVTTLLTTHEFYVVPIVNPDGYEFSRTTTRLWRKNRKANTGGSYGVDLNRNWNDHWGGQGSSGTPTDDTYRGTGPFSEPESLAVSRFVTANGPFAAAIDYHSYSQLVLRPYGWTNAAPPNEAIAKIIGDNISATIRAHGGKVYTSQASWQLYYTTGSAQDWYYGQAKVPVSYTIELRDTGTYGFTLPANQIVPTGVENYAAFKNFVLNVPK